MSRKTVFTIIVVVLGVVGAVSLQPDLVADIKVRSM